MWQECHVDSRLLCGGCFVVLGLLRFGRRFFRFLFAAYKFFKFREKRRIIENFIQPPPYKCDYRGVYECRYNRPEPQTMITCRRDIFPFKGFHVPEYRQRKHHGQHKER